MIEMIDKPSNNKQHYLRERIVINLLKDIPTIALGSKLRYLIYRNIFASIGKSVFIQNDVEFLGVDNIEIGDEVYIFKGARLDGRGSKNNKIILANKVIIERNVEIGCLENSCINIDEDTFIAPGVCIGGPGDIKIGKQCLIAAYSAIIANNHIFTDTAQPIKNQGVSRKGIVIEDDCWLGHGVAVLDGVTIGKGSVIGAGSVVTKNIPSYSVAVGTPARVIKSRKENEEN
jgi:acetyltransferase-like isoleucine patch superfamily enzyme